MDYIVKLLNEMTIEQKTPIVKILGIKNNDNQSIINKIGKLLLPVGGLLQPPLTYSEFIEKVASRNV